MSERVWTLAIWHVVERRWIACLTSDVEARVRAVDEAFTAVVPGFCFVIEVPRDDVELIEAMVSGLPAPPPSAVFSMYFHICNFLSGDPASFAREPVKPSCEVVKVN